MSEILERALSIKGFEQEFAHKDDLRRVAIAEFAAKGYDEASINNILSNAGMSKGQFYYYFRNKEGLYLALIDSMIEAKKKHTLAVMTTYPLSGDFFTQLRSYFAIGIDFAMTHPEIDRFGASFVRERGRPIYARALEVFNFRGDAAIGTFVAQAKAKNEIRHDLPEAFVANVLGVLFTHLGEIGEWSSASDVGAVADKLMQFLQGGLATKDDAPLAASVVISDLSKE